MTSALVVLAEGFEDVEAVTVIDILRRAEVGVTVAGVTPGLVRGARGVRVQTDVPMEEMRGRLFDVIVLPGGKGVEVLAASAAVKESVLGHHRAGKIVAAICAAPAAVLAPWGLLDGRSATGFPGTESGFPPSCAFKAEPVVVDGNLVTSRALGTALAFSLKLLELLVGRPMAEAVAHSVLA